jgi:hypothetical protein|tara:strand:- start:157 stop:345 length:189 start_codon:yes stop_codon:yes gene_type:complete
MLKKLLPSVTISIAILLMTGCKSIEKSRIPEFIEKLNQQEFNLVEKKLIGEILNHVNYLENK